jgi:pimeloyl-ACP methyl ester carboxylesterase
VPEHAKKSCRWHQSGRAALSLQGAAGDGPRPQKKNLNHAGLTAPDGPSRLRNRARIVTTGPWVKPTLFINGENSNYIAEKDIPAAKAFFPLAEFVTLAGAGHWVHVDAPETFHRLVLAFLIRN